MKCCYRGASNRLSPIRDNLLAKNQLKRLRCGCRPSERATPFKSVNSAGTAVTGRALNRYNAWAAIRKRAKAAGFLTPVGCHTWRATGITIYLENDGRLEHAQQSLVIPFENGSSRHWWSGSWMDGTFRDFNSEKLISLRNLDKSNSRPRGPS